MRVMARRFLFDFVDSNRACLFEFEYPYNTSFFRSGVELQVRVDVLERDENTIHLVCEIDEAGTLSTYCPATYDDIFHRDTQ
jgi:hypothetical protein